MAKAKNTEVKEAEVETLVEPETEQAEATEVVAEAVMTQDEEDTEDVTNVLMKWYVLSTRSGYEKKVASQIEQRAKTNGLEDEILQVIVPTQEKVIAKEGKKKTLEERIFPGYVLVHMIMNDLTWHLVRNTEGVTGFVGAAKTPTPLSEEEVKAILAFTEVKQTSYHSAYRVGDPVKVTDGPFKDLIGNIQEINQDKGQLTVLLSMFGRDVPVQLDFLQVTNL